GPRRRAAQGRQPGRGQARRAGRGRDWQERDDEGLGHRRRHHRSRRRQGGQEAGRRAGQDQGHRRRRVQPAQEHQLVVRVGLGWRRQEERDEQQELVVVVVVVGREGGQRQEEGRQEERQPDGRVGAVSFIQNAGDRRRTKRGGPAPSLFLCRRLWATQGAASW